jgi:hypothetical protein
VTVLTQVSVSVGRAFESLVEAMDVWMVTSLEDIDDDTTLLPLTAGGTTTVTVLGGAVFVIVKVLQVALDEAAGASTRVTEVTSWIDVTTDKASEE